MRKLVLFFHTSLDGLVAGPNGEMDWIIVDEEIFDYAGRQTDRSDTALYGRVTYQMMQDYWPTAADQPNASKHDKEHSAWYNQVKKVVISKTMKDVKLDNTTILSDHIASAIVKLKQEPGKDILMLGSPRAAHALMAENLIDDYWLFVNPILLGQGVPLFKDVRERTKLKLISSQALASGVVCNHYETKK